MHNTQISLNIRVSFYAFFTNHANVRFKKSNAENVSVKWLKRIWLKFHVLMLFLNTLRTHHPHLAVISKCFVNADIFQYNLIKFSYLISTWYIWSQTKETSPQKVRKCFQIEMRTLDVMNQLFHILPGFSKPEDTMRERKTKSWTKMKAYYKVAQICRTTKRGSLPRQDLHPFHNSVFKILMIKNWKEKLGILLILDLFLFSLISLFK